MANNETNMICLGLMINVSNDNHIENNFPYVIEIINHVQLTKANSSSGSRWVEGKRNT